MYGYCHAKHLLHGEDNNRNEIDKEVEHFGGIHLWWPDAFDFQAEKYNHKDEECKHIYFTDNQCECIKAFMLRGFLTLGNWGH